MKRVYTIFLALILTVTVAIPATFAADEMLKKMNEILKKGPAERHYQVTADEVYNWMKMKKTDFLVVDVRFPNDYRAGHIPGAINIPYNEMLEPANLNKLPKNKKIVLACYTGQTDNLPLIPLRALGYNALAMSFGNAAWIKGSSGAMNMEKAIKGAATKNYPVVK